MAAPVFLKSYFLAEKSPQERRWVVGMARVFTWCAITGFCVQALASFVMLDNPKLGVFALGCIMAMLYAIHLNDIGKTKQARILRMVIALIFFSLITAYSGGLNSPCFYWAPVFVLGSMFSFGTQSALPTFAFLIGLATFFYARSPNHFIYFEYATGMLFIYLLSYLFDRLSHHFISYAERQKSKAEEAREWAETARKNTKSILESINEGILSILPGGTIDHIESPYFSRLTGHEPYTGRTLKEVLLDKLAISSDQRDQCWQALDAVIGESELNFDANESCLVNEAPFVAGTINKVLRLKWSPILDDGTVTKITLSVEDITEQRRKDQELSQRKRELAIIGQLVEVAEEKSRTFFLTAHRLLNENAVRLRQASLSHDDVRILFVNAHTIKGAARTLGFQDLSPVIHDAEESYQKILRSGVTIDIVLLQKQHKDMLDMLDMYEFVNFQKLKRSKNFEDQHLSIERSFMEKHYQVLFEATTSIGDRNLSLDEFVRFLRDQNRELASRIFELLPTIMTSYGELAQKTAVSLQKPKPRYAIDVPEIVIHPDMRYVLDNCMTHIMRNAVDHGIESAEERLKKGKQESGLISINATERDGMISIRIHDDGRGLAIEKLKKKYSELPGMPANPTLQDFADLIFVSGLSTSEQITEISGRGVGMDAVKRYLTDVGGSIRIELLGPLEPGYQKFNLLIDLPSKPQGKGETVPGQARVLQSA